ncbi:trehalose-phosphatase [Arthrobacter sp. H14-L1]|uniref:trehalose-phosphatase n=1 Tax=Arthrobacter sp. H14-L1 TaxID=2996697 RepID=UPI00226EF6CE|nr:trehalose-phosphatase [Arthrobacter sp. H14-L1]MCY0906070.1 trehalose-phosphatase [Arthrobacter sp. H14-L1]
MTADPTGLPADLSTAVERLCRTPRLLVAMDFDGTMAPLVPRAGDARPLPATAAAFAALAHLPGTTTALISGRALASLRAVASPPPEALLIGSHGAEVWLGPDARPLTLTQAQARLLGRARALVQGIAGQHPGTLLEEKPAGVVLHTRLAEDSAASAAVEQAHLALDALPGVYVSEGKRVLELSVVRADKGDGLRTLRDAVHASAVLFAGDDVTDEYGFGVLGPQDVGVKVGAGQTAAQFRIGSPDDVAPLLELVLGLRSARS